MPDLELRRMVREAAVEHNANVLGDAPRIDKVRLADLVDVNDVMARFDAGQQITSPPT